MTYLRDQLRKTLLDCEDTLRKHRAVLTKAEGLIPEQRDASVQYIEDALTALKTAKDSVARLYTIWGVDL